MSAMTAVVALIFAPLSSCSDDADTMYARHDAFLRVTPVSTIHPLHSALNSPGMFCQITFSATHYQFLNKHGRSASMPRTALDAYGEPRFIRGFIVGLPKGVLSTSGTMMPIAYDLVCPNCFDTALIQRRLTLSEDGKASCKRCESVFNMNNGGFPESGPSKVKLLQYHIQYANDALVVHN